MPRTIAACVALALLLALPSTAGCGEGAAPGDGPAAATGAATAFLDALGNRDLEALRSRMSAAYLESNGVPDPITRERLDAAIGSVSSYRFVPEEDVTTEEDRAVITVDLEIAGKGLREETLIMSLEDGEWKVDAFTAMDWSKQPVVVDRERVEAEESLRDFLVACIDGDTRYIFENLTPDYKEKHRLERPWSAAEFSGVFGTARSFDFDADAMDIEDGAAEADVTVEFGSRGNLEPETSRVVLVREGSTWLVDVFPFFIY